MSRIITAIVAKENLRSIRLCERNGLRSQVEYDPAHIRLTGNFTRAK
jgi:RimJ/RimL family protein N-acetyltransferase